MTALVVALYALIAAGVARAEADRRSRLRAFWVWPAALPIGALWPLMLVVALASKAWTVAGEWL